MKKPRQATLRVALAAITAVAFFAPTQAGLAESPPVRPQSAVSAQPRVDGADSNAGSTQAAVEAYWTPERMRDAIPADKLAPTMRRPSTHERQSVDAPVIAAVPQAPAVPPATSPAIGADAVATAAVKASPTVGKIFFHNVSDGLNYVCSGSTINNPTKNMVVTAGHCVHGGRGGTWHTNRAFVPYYDHGQRPYGTWSAKKTTTFDGWIQDGNYDWDVAFVNVGPTNNTRLVNLVGGNGLAVNYPKNLYVTLLGYPAKPPFDGEQQDYCQGNMYAHGGKQVGFDCLITGGASGGPFLYQDSAGIRYVNSVISNGPDTSSYGPYFDTDVWNLYNSVKDVS